MPSYNYKCNTCTNTITITRGIADQDNNPICIHCSTQMVRDYSSPAITFKGDGWAGKEKRKS